MRTLRQLAELILLRFYGGQISADAKISEQEVAIHIVQARDYMIRVDLFEKMKHGDNSPDSTFFTRFTLDVEFSEERQVSFINLPATPVNLPHDKGIIVRSPISKKDSLVRVPHGATSLVSGLIEDMEGNQGWEHVEAQILELHNILPKDNIKTLMVEIIAVGDENEDLDNPIRMPSSYEEQVLIKVLQILGQGQPVDLANDNRDQPS